MLRSVCVGFGTRALVPSILPSRVLNNRGFSSLLATAASENTNSSIERLRNIAIIAHVDHGKTTLVDCLLRQSSTKLGASSDGLVRMMDSNALEKERGITIFSKTASVDYNEHRINIVDTPGHADFGGEVERILSMVDGVALVVDATEGPMTQTRFVLSKALKQGLKYAPLHVMQIFGILGLCRPLVVINKVDRPTARVSEVETEILDLFLTLDASESQLDYPLVYASAKEGWAVTDMGDDQPRTNMTSLFDLILKHVPAPQADLNGPFSMLVTQLESDSYVGKCFLGRIRSGKIRVGDQIRAMDETGTVTDSGKVIKLFQRVGLDRLAVNEASAGDIITVAGLGNATVNSTLCDQRVTQPLKSIPIDPPTVSMLFTVNDSPLQGDDGSKLTSNMIRERLLKEAETDVAIKLIQSDVRDAFEVRGRGELHLGILLENMRREGFELSVSPPRVIYRRDVQGQVLEPIEEVLIDIPVEYSGTVIQKMNRRKGDLKNYVEQGDRLRLTFEIPSRGLLGYPSEFKHETSGKGILNSAFIGYQPFKGQVDKSRKGSIISSADGNSNAYAIQNIEPRGILFIRPGDKVYTGMVIGEHNKELDLEVNPVKTKQLTNIRAVSKDEMIKLVPPKIMTLEQVLSYIQPDEMVEVTPKSIRIRKKYLDPNVRRSNARKSSNTDTMIFE